MKLTKKKVLVVALAVCLVAILSMGSLAWFSTSDDITNNFYVGTTEDDDSGKDVFGIDVWETDPTTSDKDQDGLEYTEVLPGDVYHKDPTFTNTGVHPQFVRATVTVSDADVLIEAIGGDFADPSTLFKGLSTDWTFDGVYYADDELIYVFYYNDVLAAKADTSAIFTEVEIPLELTLEQAQAMSGDAFSINIFGEAIQSENLGVNSAKDAFDKYQPEDLTNIYNGTDVNWIVNKNINGDEIATFDLPTGFYLVNANVNTDSGIKLGADTDNTTLIIDGGNFNVADGKVVSADAEAAAVVVYAYFPMTINGQVVNNETEAAPFFDNVMIIDMGAAGSLLN